jgi:hypothetical protein
VFATIFNRVVLISMNLNPSVLANMTMAENVNEDCHAMIVPSRPISII